MKAVIGRQDVPGLVIMFILGLGISVLGAVKLKNAADTGKWPATDGIITGSDVGTSGTKYYPAITYSYTVDDIEYASDVIGNMKFNSKYRDNIEEFLQKYQLNSKTRVYYNADEPSMALLEPGIARGNFMLLAFGILILAVPIFLLSFMKLDLKKTS